jgi:hypothetical protein
VGATSGSTPATNTSGVASAYTNLQKLDSYHLEILVTGLDVLLPVGLGDKLNYTIDVNHGNQHIIVVDGTGAKQEAYQVGGKSYLVTNGQAAETTSLPLVFTLPSLLYSSMTAPGAVAFTAVSDEQVNGRATTRYDGKGHLKDLSSNPLIALALAGADGDISGPIWIDRDQSFLVASDQTINLTTPRQGTTKLRMDVTKVGQVGPIELPH